VRGEENVVEYADGGSDSEPKRENAGAETDGAPRREFAGAKGVPAAPAAYIKDESEER
jgi:hypothetical protein